MKDLTCKKCGALREVGRRLCKDCNNKRLMEYPRYTWVKNCLACGVEYKAWRKEQSFCINCYELQENFRKENPANGNYTKMKKTTMDEHRFIATSILGRKLASNEVIHHLDHDAKNNKPDNLLLMTRSMHGKLHHFLDTQRVILEKSRNENQENCWNNLIIPMTTAWLETTNAKVQKLSEIGQSAAEPLSSDKE